MKTKKYCILVFLAVGISAVAYWSTFVEGKESKPVTNNSIQQLTVADEERDTLVGLQGVCVLLEVESQDGSFYGLRRQTLQRDTELRLRQNGIRVFSVKEVLTIPGSPMLYINVNINIFKITPAELDLVEREYPIFKEMDVRGKKIEELGLASVAIDVRLAQAVLLLRDVNVLDPSATTWQTGSVFGAPVSKLPEVRKFIQENVDIFINDYLAANPKKQPKDEKPKVEQNNKSG